MGLITKSSKELRGYILELRKTFKDSIKIHDIYLILEELKGNYLSKKLIMN